MSDFALGPPDSAAKVLAMKSAGWLAVGLRALFGSRSCGRMGILTWHRVSPVIAGVPPPTQNVTPDQFRRQLTGLLDRGFSIRPLRDMLRLHARGGALAPKTIALTFDDGFQSVYAAAWPILREFDLPATVFLATAYLDSDEAFPFDAWGRKYQGTLPPASFRPLTVAQCREMAAGGRIELAAHSHTHRDLRGRPECFARDVQVCIDFLRSEFRVDEVLFAFPYGASHAGFAGPEMASAARQGGAVCGLTTDCALIEPGSDPLAWGRFNVFPWDTAATLSAKLDGWYTWAARLKQFLAGPASQPAHNQSGGGV